MIKGKNQGAAIIELPKSKRNLVRIGCICLMMSIACFGLSLSVIQKPILESMGAMEHFSTLTIFATLGLSILTPIGGKLGDLFGRRNVVIISGLIAAVCGIGLGIVKSIVPFMILRLILGAAQGAFTAAPYILMGEINESKDIPKNMGLLSSSISIGGLGGSIVAGILADLGLLNAGIIFPVIPLLIGVALIAFNLPNKKREEKADIDFLGVIFLALFLCAFLLSLNYGPKIGWINPIIIIGLIASVILGVILVKIENRASEPIIPMRLFLNKKYTILLLIGAIAYFYQDSMNVYMPLAAQSVMGISATVSGTLQFPRMIVMMVLPVVVGTWIVKKHENRKISMIMATGITGVLFFILGFTNSSTSIILYFVVLGFTGVAESFKSVSITPTAQSVLNPADLGVGTSLITFVNSLSTLLSAGICGVVYDINRNDVQASVNSVFFVTSIVAFIGILIVIFGVKTKDFKKE